MPSEAPDPRELTLEEAFSVRRVAVLLTCKLSRHRLARKLHGIADDHDAPQACEACHEPATGADSDGIPLCDACGSGLETKQEADHVVE